jgi:SAM-dependent methyltransferase
MKRTSEKRHWDEFWASSPGIDDVYANDDRLVTFLLSQIDVKGKRVLEVGAGTGRDSLALARAGARVVTFDYSDESLRLIEGIAGNEMDIVCGDALALPFADGSFDIVFHQGLLEHFREPHLLLRENHRVLRTRGHLLVDVPQRYHYYTLMKDEGKLFAGAPPEQVFHPPHLRRLRAEQRLGVGNHPAILLADTFQRFQIGHARVLAYASDSSVANGNGVFTMAICVDIIWAT